MDMKVINGYENYMITEDGRVWSIKANKFLCIWKGTDGRNTVTLYKEGKRHIIRVYKLVANAFLPNPDNKPMVNHIDGNCGNDNVNNLEWCTNAENVKQGYNQGMYHSRKSCPLLVISKKSGMIYNFKSIRECAKILKIHRKGIECILKGKKNNHYDYDFYYDD